MTPRDFYHFFNTNRPKSAQGVTEQALALSPPPGSAVWAVDLCCGTGHLAAAASEAGYRMVGVDISSQFIGKAAAGTDARFVLGDMMRIPLTGACADVLFSIDSLQFAADPGLVLAEIARVVKPGGTLILSIQNYTNPTGIKKRLIERFTGRTWSPWLVHPYDHRLTYRWLMRGLERRGFHVDYVRGRLHLLAWISLLPEILRKASPWPHKPHRSLHSLAHRLALPARLEESALLAPFGMLLLVRARRREV